MSVRPLGAFAIVSLVVGVDLTIFADSGWAFVVGITFLLAFAASAFVVSIARSPSPASAPRRQHEEGPRR
jgi:hypothetical protein